MAIIPVTENQKLRELTCDRCHSCGGFEIVKGSHNPASYLPRNYYQVEIGKVGKGLPGKEWSGWGDDETTVGELLKTAQANWLPPRGY